MSNSPSNSSFVIDGVSYEELFKRLDKNGDGKIDFDELMEYMSRNSSASSDRATSVRVKFSSSFCRIKIISSHLSFSLRKFSIDREERENEKILRWISKNSRIIFSRQKINFALYFITLTLIDKVKQKSTPFVFLRLRSTALLFRKIWLQTTDSIFPQS